MHFFDEIYAKKAQNMTLFTKFTLFYHILSIFGVIFAGKVHFPDLYVLRECLKSPENVFIEFSDLKLTLDDNVRT